MENHGPCKILSTREFDIGHPLRPSSRRSGEITYLPKRRINYGLWIRVVSNRAHARTCEKKQLTIHGLQIIVFKIIFEKKMEEKKWKDEPNDNCLFDIYVKTYNSRSTQMDFWESPWNKNGYGGLRDSTGPDRVDLLFI